MKNFMQNCCNTWLWFINVKFFKKESIKSYLAFCRETGYLLDIELLAFGLYKQLKFIEIPVNWQDRSGSKVNVLKDGIKMAAGILRVRKNFKKSSEPQPLPACGQREVLSTSFSTFLSRRMTCRKKCSFLFFYYYFN